MRTRDGVGLEMLKNGSSGEAMLQEIVGAGLAHLTGNRLIPTREGLVVADRLTLGFMG
jgi:hypothetical protein